MSSELHVVVGGGPVGVACARELISQGHTVRLASRRNRLDPNDGEIAFVPTDIRHPGQLAEAVRGATVIYCTANAPYHRWPAELPGLWRPVFRAAEDAGAALVLATNLYAFGAASQPFSESSPLNPVSRKGRVRADLEQDLLKRAAAGRLDASIVRASDFYGHGARDSIFGARFLGKMLNGKPGQLFGNRAAKHSYSYVGDFASTLVAAGARRQQGATWLVPNAPPVSINELETILAGLFASLEISASARIATVGRGGLSFAGMFVPAAREVIEMLYEWQTDFTTDSSITEGDLGVGATPLLTGLAEELQHYR